MFDLWTRYEPIHAVTYFSPDAAEAAAKAGYRGFWMGYFGQRAAPLGAVGPAVVTACFYGFHPDRVARAFEYWRNVDKSLGDRVEQGVRAKQSEKDPKAAKQGNPARESMQHKA